MWFCGNYGTKSQTNGNVTGQNKTKHMTKKGDNLSIAALSKTKSLNINNKKAGHKIIPVNKCFIDIEAHGWFKLITNAA